MLQRIVRVRVTLNASECDALPCLPNRADAIEDRRDAKLFVVGSPFFVGLSQPVRGGGNEIENLRFGQQITSELLDRSVFSPTSTVSSYDHESSAFFPGCLFARWLMFA